MTAKKHPMTNTKEKKLSMLDFPLMLQVKLPAVDRVHPQVTSLLHVWKTRLQVTKTLMTALPENMHPIFIQTTALQFLHLQTAFYSENNSCISCTPVSIGPLNNSLHYLTCESLEELEKAVEILACGSCSHSISHSPKLPLVFL